MSYPDIDDSDFNKEITNKFIKYKIPKKKKTFDELCFPKEFQLQLPQKLLSQIINPKTPYKGILVYHRIGSGKTCTAITIGEQWKHKRRIMVLVPASLVGNFRGELRSKCGGNAYLTDKEREKLKTLHPSSPEYKEIIERSDERINEYYTIYSYNKFVTLAQNNKINLRNTLLIVDEIQNMVSEAGTFYEVLYDMIHRAPAELRIVLLSATPMFDRPVEIALTMNLLRLPYELPTGTEFEKMFIRVTKNVRTGQYSYSAKNLDTFKERVKGHISYFRGAPPYVFPETTIKYVKCEMSEFQYKSYVTVLESEKENKTEDRIRTIRAFRKGQILDLPNNFFIGTRLISNVAFPNKDINERGFKSFKGKALELENLQNYSIKFYKIIKKINSCPGPVFVYSGFLEYGGLKSFARALEAQGYKDYREFGEGRKRFAMMTGDETAKFKDEIKAVYNQTGNLNGSKLKVLLLSPSAKEGISLRGVRQAHIMEPYWNYSRILQIIGRGSRYCSHRDLPEEKRNLKVYIYLAVHENENETIDQYIAKLAKQKDKLINEFETAMKEIAIDCELNKHANVFPEFGEDDILCEP
ncbi:SNF2 helicase [Fadolivirus algeromassiliense]|jgi:superfamily II DNA or RNA helicase|uniref:SNF2 helicase n=1 Tax=Fadolivirus FV1/VV64 TaxID=3070911 RepID=A0A7D3QUI3_9VIRU|nr:SNF2 helicase [Fadolivirus algeromassiliense]QKF94147.1 SNF2 helicase [Fadolivirus FV1/VV64]